MFPAVRSMNHHYLMVALSCSLPPYEGCLLYHCRGPGQYVYQVRVIYHVKSKIILYNLTLIRWGNKYNTKCFYNVNWGRYHIKNPRNIWEHPSPQGRVKKVLTIHLSLGSTQPEVHTILAPNLTSFHNNIPLEIEKNNFLRGSQ